MVGPHWSVPASEGVFPEGSAATWSLALSFSVSIGAVKVCEDLY